MIYTIALQYYCGSIDSGGDDWWEKSRTGRQKRDCREFAVWADVLSVLCSFKKEPLKKLEERKQNGFLVKEGSGNRKEKDHRWVSVSEPQL